MIRDEWRSIIDRRKSHRCIVYKLLSRSTASVVLDSSATPIIDPRQRVFGETDRRIVLWIFVCNIYTHTHVYTHIYSRIAHSVRKNAVSWVFRAVNGTIVPRKFVRGTWWVYFLFLNDFRSKDGHRWHIRSILFILFDIKKHQKLRSINFVS